MYGPEEDAMFSSIKNLILIGLGINKIAFETIDSIFCHKFHEETETEELVEEFLESPKKRKNTIAIQAVEKQNRKSKKDLEGN